MMEEDLSVSGKVIIRKIYFIRNQKVMLDRDLAELYGVETKYLKRQVRRNINRFPTDFVFQLSKDEFEDWRSQNVSSNSPEYMGLRYAPYAFTEQGIAMLSGVLNSERAINVNIQIIRTFIVIRNTIAENSSLRLDLIKLKEKQNFHSKSIAVIFNLLDKMIEKKNIPRTRIEYKK